MSYPIDWSATGTWMQAWAGFAQAAAIAYAAIRAADVYSTWRRQRIEERRIEVAEAILFLAYRLRDAFETIRNPFSFGSEQEAAEKHLLDKGQILSMKTEAEKSRILTAQSIIMRINLFSDDWEKLNQILPKAEAFFGTEVVENLNVFWRKRNSISIHAEAYARGTGSDADFRKKVESTIWRVDPEHDEISTAVLDAIKNLEKILSPIIRVSAK